MIRWNYRGRQQGDAIPALGPDAYEYVKARDTLDVNVDFQLSPELFIYFNAQNILNTPEVVLRYGSQTPEYAKSHREMTHGVQLTLGVKGTF